MQWPATFSDKNGKQESEIVGCARRSEKQQDTALALLSRVNLITGSATLCEQRLASLPGSLPARHRGAVWTPKIHPATAVASAQMQNLSHRKKHFLYST